MLMRMRVLYMSFTVSPVVSVTLPYLTLSCWKKNQVAKVVTLPVVLPHSHIMEDHDHRQPGRALLELAPFVRPAIVNDETIHATIMAAAGLEIINLFLAVM